MEGKISDKDSGKINDIIHRIDDVLKVTLQINLCDKMIRKSLLLRLLILPICSDGMTK